MNPTEKLIILVQPHSCLYNTSDRDYKNIMKKDIIWEKISKELKQSRDAIKTKWKNLKDGYTKYKKQIKGTTGQQKKYNSWVWGPYLEFLDSCVLHRPTTSNVTIITNEVLRTAETAINSPLSPASNSSQATADLTEDFMPSASSSPRVSRDIPFLSSETPYTPETPSTSRASNKRKSDSQDEIDKVLNYLKNKKKNDAVDYLFSSYAETFKKLKPRTQAELKLKLAQVFTEAELKDLESENEIQLVPMLSPSYSFISTLDNDQESAPDSSVPIQFIAEDLSVPIVKPAHTDDGVEDLTVSAGSEELYFID